MPRPRRSTPLFAGFWLVLIINPIMEYWDRIEQPAVLIAYLLLIPFTAMYLGMLFAIRNLPLEFRGTLPGVQAWGGITALLVICFAMSFGWGQNALNLTAFAVLAAGLVLPTRQSMTFVLVFSLLAYALTLTVPGWFNDINVPLVLIGAGLVMANMRQTVVNNIDLFVMRQENESLLVDQERNRFARDLHDILGHSLTVVALKAELAGKLIDRDLSAAKDEVRDLERLSREALLEVREAVTGYRGITLPGEIARARLALSAAGIEAKLPSSADDVSGSNRELFAWAIREGVTNVVRHGGPGMCVVELTGDRLVIRNQDPNPGVPIKEGHGLAGLRERAAAVGAQMSVSSTAASGFVLEVRGGASS